MKTKTHHTDTPHGARFTLLLIPLFAAVVCAAFAILYPGQIASALDTCNDLSSLSNPQISISGIAVPDDALISDVTEISNYNVVVCYDTETADGKQIRLIGMNNGSLNLLLHVTDGYVPQLTPYECAVVALSPNAAPAIGTAIRPCDENGNVILSADGTPCQLTVVGIGENIHSALSPITDPAIDYLVYTASDEAWHTEDAVYCLLLDGFRTDDPYAAAQTLYQTHADAQNAYLAAQAEERRTALMIAAEEADKAVLAQEIVLQNLDNRLDTVNLRVSELENNMMDAVALLQAERQQFVSDMEYNEYYALRQVDLIPRRDRAEEGYAKQEAVIETINAELHAAYAERNQLAAEHAAAEQTRAALQDSADTALAALKSLQNQPHTTAAWDIIPEEQHPGYVILQTHAAAVRKTAMLVSMIALGIYLVGSITLYAVSHRVTQTLFRAICSAALIAVPAILFGGCMMTKLIFASSYPALRETLVISIQAGDILGTGAIVLLAAAVVSFIASAVGHRIQRIQHPVN